MSKPVQPLVERLQDEADLCRNDGADDIAALLDEAVAEIRGLMQTLRDELDENLRLRELGGALPDENITAMTERLIRERNNLRAALGRIERWQGEFPPTGKAWPETGAPMSYGSAYGSNGERDYMRQVARDALGPND